MTTDARPLGRLRVDQVGSLLRPEALKAAFRDHEAGRVDERAVRQAQDDAIRAVVAAQETHGMPIVTDGEFRREHFMQSFADVRGLERWRAAMDAATRTLEPGTRVAGQAHDPNRTLTPAVTAELRLVRNRPLEEYRFVQPLTDRPVKVTIISPDRISHTYDRAASRPVYEDVDAFLADVVAVGRRIIAELVAAGCRYVQIDGPGYTAYVDPSSIAAMDARGDDPLKALERAIGADNALIAGFPGVTFGLHVCRGNRQSRWHREGHYDAIAERLFAGTDHDRLLLEYDDERAGDFAALRFVPAAKTAVLGLITTKRGQLEPVDDLRHRIDEAARHLPLEQLALSPQCGFASVMAGNELTEDEQWRKLDRMIEVATRVWGAPGSA